MIVITAHNMHSLHQRQFPLNKSKVRLTSAFTESNSRYTDILISLKVYYQLLIESQKVVLKNYTKIDLWWRSKTVKDNKWMHNNVLAQQWINKLSSLRYYSYARLLDKKKQKQNKI